MMLCDSQTIKKSIRLRINGDLLLKAGELNLDLSAILEKALAQRLGEKQGRLWGKQNAKAIQTYNQFVEEQGVFSDGLRNF